MLIKKLFGPLKEIRCLTQSLILKWLILWQLELLYMYNIELLLVHFMDSEATRLTCCAKVVWICDLRQGVDFIIIFTSSFCARSSPNIKNSVKLSVSFYVLGIYERKSCRWNVNEIERRWTNLKHLGKKSNSD